MKKVRPSREGGKKQEPDNPPIERFNFRLHELVPIELGLFLVAFLSLCGRGSMKDAHLESKQKIVLDAIGVVRTCIIFRCLR